ncbi:TonB-dependent receptor plug domain-containing protein [Acinetobacter bouvetii]|uniref:TonB-dependent Receptor Plug Domain protein n=1 Tax=Acinetobacter bouvetii TaxID=202951 RepID=A0A811GD65_9GAMM|nr:TonB-dependent receptor plug domain-containing protein [Acinetobacter bouvetii]CAB1214532.1 TonB-dependent Receptor Plug Domain protein [Acinetobacter bouvetii]
MRFAYSPLSFAILTLLSTSVHANDISEQKNSKQMSESIALNPIVLQAEKTIEIGTTTYTKEDLQKTPNSSKNITDFLKVNPNVQFDREQRSSRTQGELRPAEVSINGAQYYQNKFLVNGVNNSNVMDPGGALGKDSYQGFDSGSQGMAINADLLCKLEVLDSNVSAEYGEFSGGVISAETCAPTSEVGKIHGSITYDYTESDWARYNIFTPEDIKDFDEPTQSNQKEFKKQGLSANLYGRMSENLGINLYGSKRQSIIPVMSGISSPEKIDQERNNTNAGATFYYQPNAQNNIKFGFDYGDIDALTYIESRRNSGATTNTESTALFAEIETRLNTATVTQKLNYQRMDSQRVAENHLGIFWQYAPGSKDWTEQPSSATANAAEGTTSGSLNQFQDSLSYSLKSVFDSFNFGNTQHTWTLGAGYDHYNAKWERPTDLYNYNAAGRTNLSSGQSCQPDDFLCDSATTLNGKSGQYFFKGVLYKAGSAQAQQDRWHAYVQDQILWKNLDLRLGLRSDYDSLSSQYNIAPRSALTYRPLHNESLKLVTGFNRYYSAQTLATELRQQIANLKYDIERETKNPATLTWKETQNSGYRNDSTNLKTPYSDETLLGLITQFNNWEMGLKWVNRHSKDEITRDRYVSEQSFNGKTFLGTDYFTYGNNGRSQSDIYTFTLKNLSPFKLLSSSHQFALGFDYTDVQKNFIDYHENYQVNTPNEEDRLVQYGDKIIHWSDRPAENFNQPWTARISWDIGFEQLPLKINNFFSYKSAYDDALKVKDIDYQGEMINAYEILKVKPRFSWDMRTSYDFNLAKDNTVTLGLTINNVTNRKNTYTGSYLNSNTLKSEIGRQFIADVTFKF